MRILGVASAAWLNGLAAYVAALQIIWGQRVSPGDLVAVLSRSAFAALIATIGIFVPVMFGLRKWIVGRAEKRWWVFVGVGVLLGFAPVWLDVTIWSNHTGRALLSPEAGLLYWLFGTFGAVFGGGFYLAYVRRTT